MVDKWQSDHHREEEEEEESLLSTALPIISLLGIIRYPLPLPSPPQTPIFRTPLPSPLFSLDTIFVGGDDSGHKNK